MMIKYLAKSDGETIVEHTKELLKEYDMLKKEYPTALTETRWDLLRIACQYHDLGKINTKFQKKLERHISKVDREVPHGLLSISLLPTKELKSKYGKEQVSALAYAIAYHHFRNFSEITLDNYKDEIAALAKPIKEFPFSDIGIESKPEAKNKTSYFKLGFFISKQDNKGRYNDYVYLKGLLNKIDYAASGHYVVEKPRLKDLNSRLDNSILQKWQQNNPNATWNDLQCWMEENTDQSVVVVAQTGMGKTEAALKWLQDNKGFFVLPLKAAINSIYDRIRDDIFKDDYQNIGVLHSDMSVKLLETNEQNKRDFDDYLDYMTETKSLALPLTVTTLDQIFDFVYLYQGYEMKLATLSYSKIIIDEIQMYSADLLGYIIYGLKTVQEFGGKFNVMTATLAPFILDLFAENNLKFVQPNGPFYDQNLDHRHSVKVVHENIKAEDIIAKFNNNKVLVVCNTIKKAMALYEELVCQDLPVEMIHSRFIQKDRSQKEKEILNFGKLTNKTAGIWIGTQIVEASLDIDFDILVTELSELNGLFQRMGRCYRKRNFEQLDNYNVYVYDGGSENPSGIKDKYSVVDMDMFKLAKEAVATVDGRLTEKQKVELINNYYTTDKLKDSAYLNKVKDTISYLDFLDPNELKPKEVKERFRDINSITIIPRNVYDSNRERIDEIMNNLENGLCEVSKEQRQEQRIKLRQEIMQYTMSVPQYFLDDQQNETLKLSKYEQIYILSDVYVYDEKKGLIKKNSEEVNGEDNLF